MPEPLPLDPEQTAVREPGAAPVVVDAILDDGATADLPQIPGYEVHREIARGAMGRVLAARDLALDREVAIKVILAGHTATGAKQRFIRESKITARLPHPGIPPIHALGVLPDGRPFLAMKLVRGQTLAELLRTRREPAQFLQIFEAICQTVAFAHAEGIIHRDLKPANVMVGAFGEVQVMDWGLARLGQGSGHRGQETGSRGQESEATEADSMHDPIGAETWAHANETADGEEPDQTQGGQIVGTPAYMSPEQARGEVDRVDARSDVFALGIILCEILTGQVSFAGKTTREVLQRAAACDLNETVIRLDSCGEDAELVGLAKRCLAPEPADRPANGTAVAEAMAAYRAGVEERLRRAQADRAAAEVREVEGRRRRKVQLALGGAVAFAVLLGVGAAVLGTFWKKAESAKESAEQARDGEQQARLTAEDAKKAEAVARNDAEGARDGEALARKKADALAEKVAGIEYGRAMQVAYEQWRDNFIASARDLLAGTREDLRGWEWHYVHRLCNADYLMLLGHNNGVRAVSFNADGSRIVTAGSGIAKVWDGKTGAELFALEGHTDAILSVSFSPDGSRILTASHDLTVKLWDARTGAELLVLKGHTDRIQSAAFSADGSRIVSGGWDKTAKIWDAKTGNVLLTIDGHANWVGSAAFNADGSRIVTTEREEAKVWDAKSGAKLLTLKGHTSIVGKASFSSDGSKIVTTSLDNTAKVWDAKTGAVLLTLKGHAGSVNSARFNTEGTRIVTGSNDKTVKLWDAKTGAELRTIKGHSLQVNSVSFSADGARIVSGSNDNTARVWDAKVEIDVLTLKGHGQAVNQAMFSADVTRVVTASEDRSARVWDATTGAELLAVRGHIRSVHSARFNADGSRITTTEGDVGIVWDAKSGAELETLKNARAASGPARSADGSRTINATLDDLAIVRDAKTRALLLTLKGHTSLVNWAAFSPDGSRIVTASDDRTVKIWDAATGAELLSLKGHTGPVNSAWWSADGSRIVSGSADGTAKIWDARPVNREFFPRELAPPPRVVKP